MWNRVTDLIRNDFDVEVVDNYKFVTTNILYYKDEIKTDLHGERVPLEKASF